MIISLLLRILQIGESMPDGLYYAGCVRLFKLNKTTEREKFFQIISYVSRIAKSILPIRIVKLILSLTDCILPGDGVETESLL